MKHPHGGRERTTRWQKGKQQGETYHSHRHRACRSVIGAVLFGIQIHCLLPTLNPNTDLGRSAIAAYAERAAMSTDEFAKRLAPHLTPAIMGDAVVELYSDPSRWDKVAYEIGGAGLKPLN